MKKLVRFIIDVLLLSILFGLVWIRYNQRVAEVGEPTHRCPICGKEVKVVSDHYYYCIKSKIEKEIDNK